MSEYKSVRFARLGLLVKRVFGWQIAQAIYVIWGCLRTAYECTIANNYWRSAFWFKPFDEHNRYRTTPFYSYPAIAYFRRLDWRGKHVCEIGGGYSTGWWASRCKRVTTIDHLVEWVNHEDHLNVTPIQAATPELMAAAIPLDADVYIVDNSGDRSPVIARLLTMDLTCRIVILDNAECYEDLADKLTARCKHWASFEGYAPGQTKDLTTIWWF